jgi:hypothetical protein
MFSIYFSHHHYFKKLPLSAQCQFVHGTKTARPSRLPRVKPPGQFPYLPKVIQIMALATVGRKIYRTIRRFTERRRPFAGIKTFQPPGQLARVAEIIFNGSTSMRRSGLRIEMPSRNPEAQSESSQPVAVNDIDCAPP